MAVIIYGIDIPKKHYMNGYYISDDGKVFDISRKNVIGEKKKEKKYREDRLKRLGFLKDDAPDKETKDV